MASRIRVQDLAAASAAWGRAAAAALTLAEKTAKERTDGIVADNMDVSAILDSAEEGFYLLRGGERLRPSSERCDGL